MRLKVCLVEMLEEGGDGGFLEYAGWVCWGGEGDGFIIGGVIGDVHEELAGLG